MFKLLKYIDKKLRFLSFLVLFLTTIQVIAFLFIPIFIGQISSLIAQRAFMVSNPHLPIPDYVNVTILKMFTVSGTINESLKSFSIYFVIALIIGTISTLGGSLLSSYVSNKGAKQIRQKLWEHLGNLSEKDIEHFTHSKIITRFTIDINRIQMEINLFLRLSIIGPFNLIFGLIFALLTDLQLSITLGILVPILMITMIVTGLLIKPIFSREQKMYERINNESQESILGIKVIKSYNLEKIQDKKFQDQNQSWQKTSKKSWNAYNLAFAFVNLFANLITAIILLATGYIARKNNPNVAEYKELISSATTFTNYVMFITVGIIMSTFSIFSIVKSIVSAKKINEIFDTKPDIKYVQSDLKISKGHIVFDHVSFKYHEHAEKNVLDDISFEVLPGKTLGILGVTGSGKSTIAKLINLDFKASSGTVKIDGNDITKIDTKSIRSSISHVYQKPLLLSGSIKENLLMAKKDATEEEIIDCLKSSSAYDFVFKMKDNINAEIKPKGTNLSGGQKQRLSIAQGLIKKPKILILDDSTSALDGTTEANIKKNLKNDAKKNELTTIIIAQKISSIIDADQIIVLDNGKVSAIGNHEFLLKNSPLYYEISKTQLGGQDV